VFDPVSGRLVVFGGTLSNDIHANDVWALAPDAGTWFRIRPQFFPTRNYSAVVDPVAAEMLVFGGEVPGGLSNDLAVQSLAPGPNSRRMLDTGTPWPTPRYAHRAIWDAVRDRMLVFGGYDVPSGYLNEVWEYRPRPTPTWSLLTTTGIPPAGRFAGGLLFDVARDRLLVFGGYSLIAGVPTGWSDLWALPLSGPNTLQWQALSPSGTPPSPRWGFSMLMDAPHDRAVVWGGASANYDMYQDGFSLDLSGPTPAWSTLPALGDVPSGRTIHTSVVEPVGDRLIVFGGFNGIGFLNDVHALALSGSPVWTTLHPTGVLPNPRDSDTAIYDALRQRMVVYGGFGDSYFDDTWALTWDVVVPVAASLVSASAEPDFVRLEWFVGANDRVIAGVEREVGPSLWRDLGAPDRTGSDRLVFEDRDVVSGAQYTYRLRLRSGAEETVIGPTSVAVPAKFALALLGAQPNPGSEGRLEIAFTVPQAMPVHVELLDLSGRRMASSESGASGPGRHLVEFGARGELAPGVYFIRMSAGGRTFTRRALLTR
jgi:hypothetical protein